MQGSAASARFATIRGRKSPRRQRDANPYEQDLDRNAANYAPLTPLSFIARTAYIWPEQRRRDPRRPPLHAGSETYDRCAPARLGAGEARHRRRRHGGRDARQHAGDDRGALRRADDRRRAQHAQHAARRRGDRVHARPRRGEGAPDRHRVLAGDRGGAGAAPGASRSSSTSPTRRVRAASALGATDYEAFIADGDPGVRVAAARRRMAGDLAQLHVGHHRQSEGRRLPPPRRLPQRAVQHHRLGHAAPFRVPVDAADVPLQRLVLRRGRWRPTPAPTCACARSRRRRSSTRSARTRSRTTAARRSCTRCSSTRPTR